MIVMLSRGLPIASSSLVRRLVPTSTRLVGPSQFQPRATFHSIRPRLVAQGETQHTEGDVGEQQPIDVQQGGGGNVRGRSRGRRTSRQNMNTGAGGWWDEIDDDWLDTRRDFDSFRNTVNQLLHDFDQSIGGGFLGDRGRGMGGRLLGGSVGPAGQGWFPSLLDWGTEPRRGRGGQRMLGRGGGGDMDDQSPMLLGETAGGGAGSALMPFEPMLAPMLDLMPSVQPIAIRLDVEETKDKYAVSAEVPGLKPNELKVNIDKGIITIEGRHKEEHRRDDRDRRFLRVERSLGTVRRSLRLPEDVDASKVAAKYDHGVLKVDLPKKHESERSSGNVKIVSGETPREGENQSQESGSTSQPIQQQS